MLQFSNNIFIEILMLADLLIHVNLLAFVPEEYVHTRIRRQVNGVVISKTMY